MNTLNKKRPDTKNLYFIITEYFNVAFIVVKSTLHLDDTFQLEGPLELLCEVLGNDAGSTVL